MFNRGHPTLTSWCNTVNPASTINLTPERLARRYTVLSVADEGWGQLLELDWLKQPEDNRGGNEVWHHEYFVKVSPLQLLAECCDEIG